MYVVEQEAGRASYHDSINRAFLASKLRRRVFPRRVHLPTGRSIKPEWRNGVE